MNSSPDPFETAAAEGPSGELEVRTRRAPLPITRPADEPMGVMTARLHGFDLADQPLLCDLPARPGEILPSRTTIALSQAQIGSSVVVVLDQGDSLRPIVIGVIHEARQAGKADVPEVAIQADSERFVVTAEREIVLRCGDASITLTRAGKVLIQGNYVLSRSTGYNKVKGAVVDIN
jgi:Domain of unknown function (DUF6484)